jgi:hypothetical protein
LRLRATFPVYRAEKRDLEYNLTNYGVPEEHPVSKAPDGKNLLAIRPTACVKSDNFSKICEGTIDCSKCTGCLACQIGIAQPKDGVDEVGIPSEEVFFSYKDLSRKFFQGTFCSFPSNSSKALPIIGRFDHYSGEINERNFTNPLIACYLWESTLRKPYVSCSPGHELNLDCSIFSGEREGHLDVTLRTISGAEKYLFVGEGKCNVESLLRDSVREQQKKYEQQIIALGNKHNFRSLFSYIVGGAEEPMYPPDVHEVSRNILNRGKFFDDILRNNKRFISIHALRGLGVLFIASEGKIGVENTLFKIFENEKICGLVLGGPVLYENDKFTLANLNDYVSIH